MKDGQQISYLVPAHETQTEITVVNSRFIAILAPAFSVEAARAFHDEVRKRYPDATHHVPAYVIGAGNSQIAHCSDDGEPSGTAGRPVLAVLQGSGLGDAVLIVVRYFGGIKLGTGGLVRAYTSAAQEVIAKAQMALKTRAQIYMLSVPYPLYEPVYRLVETHGGIVLDQVFATDVTLTLQFRQSDYAPFHRALQELTAGQVEPLYIETRTVLLPATS